MWSLFINLTLNSIDLTNSVAKCLPVLCHFIRILQYK